MIKNKNTVKPFEYKQISKYIGLKFIWGFQGLSINL